MYESTFGTRWACYKCQVLFFDMKKPEAICPKCGANQADNPHRIVSFMPTPKPVPDEDIDVELDLNVLGGDVGIESFEALEEAMNMDDEEEDAY